MLNRTDHLLLGYFGLVGIAVLALRPDDGRALGMVFLAAGSIVAAAAAARWRLGRLAHDFLPIPLIIVGYEASAALTAAIGAGLWDDRLAAVDARWFGVVVEHWRLTLGRPAVVTELACVAYVTFYFFPVVFAVLLHGRDGRAFAPFAHAITLTFVLSWIGYAIFPTLGPRDPLALGDGVAGRTLAALLRAVEQNPRDAFPSGHTAVALVAAWHGARRFRAAAPLIIGVAIAIVFSTVYLSFHYVIDVVAGAGLALVIVAAEPRKDRASGARRSHIVRGRSLEAPSRPGAADAAELPEEN